MEIAEAEPDEESSLDRKYYCTIPDIGETVRAADLGTLTQLAKRLVEQKGSYHYGVYHTDVRLQGQNGIITRLALVAPEPRSRFRLSL
jgi:hypothetical protein